MNSKLYNNKTIITALSVILMGGGWLVFSNYNDNGAVPPLESVTERSAAESGQRTGQTAVFAAGCFWCTEAAFQEYPGVNEAVSGYTGGTTVNPTYEQVYTQMTDHREAIKVYYDESEVSYRDLLDIFWRSIDPTDGEGQFIDRGFSYSAAIFYNTDEEKELALASKKALVESGRFDKPIVIPILPVTEFYDAEDYHQDFYKHSADRYKSYENASGRQGFKDSVWNTIEGGQ